MSAFGLWRLFHRPGQGVQRHTSLLAITAFTAATTVFLTVLGGVHGFIWRASPDHRLECLVNAALCRQVAQPAPGETGEYAMMYVVLAGFACLLLLVPFTALAGSAARLAASRRDERLAALRLAGATNTVVVLLTALDAAGQALAGAVCGIVGYGALMPAIMALNFQNRHFTVSELWVGPWALLGVCVGVTLLALASSLVTLRRVAITPLGVTRRISQPLPSAWRAVIFVLVVAGAFAVFKFRLFGNMGQMMSSLVVIGFIVGCFALVNLVGSWAISVRAKARLRRPKDAATMIAMRRILDNPKRAWRNVSGIALAVFIAGITSVASYLSTISGQGVSRSDPAVVVLHDIGTGGLLTLVFAAVLAAVSCGVMQAGNVYDQAREYRMLMLEGTDVATLNKARFAEVITPLNVVVLVAGVCSMVLMLPLVGSIFAEPSSLAFFAGGIAVCYALVSVGALASNRVASRLDFAHQRADD